jgi:hypothetical protein
MPLSEAFNLASYDDVKHTRPLSTTAFVASGVPSCHRLRQEARVLGLRRASISSISGWWEDINPSALPLDMPASMFEIGVLGTGFLGSMIFSE